MTHRDQMVEDKHYKDCSSYNKLGYRPSRSKTLCKRSVAELITDYVINVSVVMNEVRQVERRLKH